MLLGREMGDRCTVVFALRECERSHHYSCKSHKIVA